LILKGVPRKASLEAYVEEKLEKLTPLSDRILSSRVTIELPHHHKRKGAHYHVTVELALPGTELVASRNREEEPGHETMHMALRDAFAAIRRQLIEYVEKRRPPMGTPSEAR
jgi:ribosome-associated translation inhibitor RaiA